MSKTKSLPTNLLEAVRYFSDLDVATEFVAKLRWPKGPVCPKCGGVEYSYLTTRRLWKCRECKKQYSVKVGTIFEDSPLGLDKWLPAVWLAANSKNGISSHELARALGITQKSAWFMLHRIRLAMQTGSFSKLEGEVEVDESFIGGRARNMHRDVRERKGIRPGAWDKTVVLGIRQRDGELRAKVVPNTKATTLKPEVHEHVAPGASVYTDEPLLPGARFHLRPPHRRSRRGVRRWSGPYQRLGELLVAFEARPARHLRLSRAVPPVPLPRRAGVHVQPARAR